MLTIDIRRNGELVAQAEIIIDGLADTPDCRLSWIEFPQPVYAIKKAEGEATIKGHRRSQSVWALVAKATVAILDQLAGDPRGIR